jgi:hypothetical protein
VTSIRMSIALRGCLRSNPVTMFMVVSLYHRGMQECPYLCQRVEQVLERFR